MAAKAKKNRKPLILLVDDVPKNLSLLGNILAEENYDIAVATGGAQAIEIARETHPDLILLDIMMPEISGFQVCETLKDDPATRDIRILFLTAKNESDDIIKGFELGAVDYITKPFSGTELLVRIRTHLELKQSRDELQRVNEELKNKNDKLIKAYQKLKLVSRTDTLTKLSNRRDMLDKIKYEINRFDRNNINFCVIICDIDDFKFINDTYGHVCGDVILKMISTIFKKSVRKQDYVSRWGGEEFLILLPDTHINGGKTVAEKIRENIEKKIFKYEDIKLKVTMTFGVSEFNDSEQDINYFIKLADEALYEGKQSGKNRVVTSSQF